MDMPQHAKPRILVVDDESGVCLAITFLLQDRYQVITAETVPQARARLAERFDMVFLDLFMPGVSGFELLDEVHAAYPALPVVILTAAGDRHTQHQARAHGARAVLDKPFSRQELITQIEETLQAR